MPKLPAFPAGVAGPDLHGSSPVCLCRGCQVIATRGQGNIRCTLKRNPLDLPAPSARIHVPDARRIVVVLGCDDPTLGREHDALNVLRTPNDRRSCRLARYIPELDVAAHSNG